jgi:hypothetical protein
MDRSLLFTIPITPTTIDDIAKTAASIMGVTNQGSCQLTFTEPMLNTTSISIAAIMSPVDHLPKEVFGRMLIRMFNISL